MKDAKGHGSNPGRHASRIALLPRSIKMRVQQEVAGAHRTAAGQRVTNVRAVWKNITNKPKRRAVAEKIAMGVRTDDKNARTRFR
jgi:hypothetical protein